MYRKKGNIISIIILSNPSSLDLHAADVATFSVEATGEELKYQWQYRPKNSSDWFIAKKGNGCNSNTVTYSQALLFRNGFQFRCKITDQKGDVVYSDIATLTVSPNLTILEQPVSANVETESAICFSVKANGPGLSYRWEYRPCVSEFWAPVKEDSAQRDTMILKSELSEYTGYQYRCKIMDNKGNILYTDIVTLDK